MCLHHLWPKEMTTWINSTWVICSIAFNLIHHLIWLSCCCTDEVFPYHDVSVINCIYDLILLILNQISGMKWNSLRLINLDQNKNKFCFIECKLSQDFLIFIYIGLFKCFQVGFQAISTIKYRVKGRTDSCKLFVILKLKTYLILISEVVMYSVSQ